MMFWLIGLTCCQLDLLRDKISVGGISWERAPFAAKKMPGIHTCGNTTFPMEVNRMENRLILNFSNAYQAETEHYRILHCSSILNSRQMDKWQKLIKKEDELYYRFWVGDDLITAPVRNGTLVYTSYTFVIDNTGGINVEPSDLVPIEVHNIPDITSGWYVNFSFNIVSGPVEYNKIVRKAKETVSWRLPFFSLMSFLPVTIVFFVNVGKYTLISQLNDVYTLPGMINNLLLVTSLGICEFLRFVILFTQSEITWSLGVNACVFSSIFTMVLRVWLSKLIGEDQLAAQSMLSGFPLGTLLFTLFVPSVISLVSKILFGAFRDASVQNIMINWALMSTVMYSLPRGVGQMLLIIMPEKKNLFKKHIHAKRGSINIISLIAYSVGGAAILSPVIPCFYKWISGETEFELHLIFSVIICYCAYCSLFGLLRTMSRLKITNMCWHDDHMSFHGLIPLFMIIAVVGYIISSMKWSWFDLIGLAYYSAIALGIAYEAFCLGTAASYTVSMAFVYNSIIKHHINKETDLSMPDERAEFIEKE